MRIKYLNSSIISITAVNKMLESYISLGTIKASQVVVLNEDSVVVT